MQHRHLDLVSDRTTLARLRWRLNRGGRVVYKVRAIGGPWKSFEADYLVAGREAYADDATTVYTCDLIIKDLRHTAVLRMADAGCDVPTICAITGHTPKSANDIITTYLRHTRARAVLAFQKRLDHEAAQARPAENKQA